MSIYQCNTCRRLLYKPDRVPKDVWYCPTCGPTEVSDLAEPPPSRLAELLEAEYWLGLGEVASHNRAGVSIEPLAHRFLVDPRPWKAINKLVLLLLGMAIGLWIVAEFGPSRHRTFFLSLGGVCAFGMVCTIVAAAALGQHADRQSNRFQQAFTEHRKTMVDRPETRLGPSSPGVASPDMVTTDPTEIRREDQTP